MAFTSYFTFWNILLLACAVFVPSLRGLSTSLSFLTFLVSTAAVLLVGVDELNRLYQKILPGFLDGSTNHVLHHVLPFVVGITWRAYLNDTNVIVSSIVFLGWYIYFRAEMQSLYSQKLTLMTYDRIVMASVATLLLTR